MLCYTFIILTNHVNLIKLWHFNFTSNNQLQHPNITPNVYNREFHEMHSFTVYTFTSQNVPFPRQQLK